MSLRVDSHHHFWDPARAHYPWMSDAVAPLCRRFDPTDLRPALDQADIDVTVLVQTRSSLDETREFLALAAEVDFAVGVVGWVDLTAPDVATTIGELRAGPGGDRLVGIRHQAEDEEDPDWLLRSEVGRGLQAVAEAGLAYDLLVRPPNLRSAVAVARSFPDLRFVVDHAAKPEIRAGRVDGWAEPVRRLGALPNVWCKLSGLTTEADHHHWRPEDLRPYVAHIRECFGDHRLMFGSDWPVCLLAGGYETTVSSLDEVLDGIDETARAAIFGTNAAAFYHLNVSRRSPAAAGRA